MVHSLLRKSSEGGTGTSSHNNYSQDCARELIFSVVAVVVVAGGFLIRWLQLL